MSCGKPESTDRDQYRGSDPQETTGKVTHSVQRLISGKAFDNCTSCLGNDSAALSDLPQKAKSHLLFNRSADSPSFAAGCAARSHAGCTGS